MSKYLSLGALALIASFTATPVSAAPVGHGYGPGVSLYFGGRGGHHHHRGDHHR